MAYDINMAQCLRDVGRIGYTEVHNVCAGTTTTVPWGVGAWFCLALLTIVIAAVAAWIVWIEYPIWKLKRRHAAERASWSLRK